MTGPGGPPLRAFLVGCPRSGTTLLQSLLFAHPDVISFPETFFFDRVVPAPRERVRRRLGLASASAAEALSTLDVLGLPPDPRPPHRPPLTVHDYAGRFLRRMDRAAADAGAALWLEKTPRHARHLRRIEREVPGVRIIHLIRAGEAVAASLRDASLRAPEVWPSSTPPQLVEVWRRYLRLSLACVGREHHAFVSYERLVAAPQDTMRALCRFLGVRADPEALGEVLRDYAARSEAVIGRPVARGGAVGLAPEPWKAGTGDAIANRNEEKLRRLFSAEERALITAAVREQDALLAGVPFL